MKVNFNVAFKNFNGTVIQENGKDQMISVMVSSVLFIGKECKTVEEKMTAFNLSQRIYNSKGAIEISAEDATLIKRLTADSLIAGAYAQVANLVEDNTSKK